MNYGVGVISHESMEGEGVDGVILFGSKEKGSEEKYSVMMNCTCC